MATPLLGFIFVFFFLELPTPSPTTSPTSFPTTTPTSKPSTSPSTSPTTSPSFSPTTSPLPYATVYYVISLESDAERSDSYKIYLTEAFEPTNIVSLFNVFETFPETTEVIAHNPHLTGNQERTYHKCLINYWMSESLSARIVE